jgi:hypothetical protein
MDLEGWIENLAIAYSLVLATYEAKVTAYIQAVKTNGKENLQLHSFSTSGLDGVEQIHATADLFPVERSPFILS